jgi:hypothetical protein
VLEHGNSGYSAGTVVRNIMDTYFFANSNSPTEDAPFIVLD